jgi:hypothetical protein
MLLVLNLISLKPFYILSFGYFLTYFLLTIISEIFAQLLHVYEPKYKIVETLGSFNNFSHPQTI